MISNLDRIKLAGIRELQRPLPGGAEDFRSLGTDTCGGIGADWERRTNSS